MADDLIVTGSRCTSAFDYSSQDSGKLISFADVSCTGQQRQLALLRFSQALSKTSENNFASNWLTSWGVSLRETAVVSNGIVLRSTDDPPFSPDISSSGWLSRLANIRVLSPVHLRNWVIISFYGDDLVIADLIGSLIRNGLLIGIEISPPLHKAKVKDGTEEEYLTLLNQIYSKVPRIELIVVVFHVSRTDLYQVIKKWALLSTHKPIPTQILLRETARRVAVFQATAFSVISQINCKLGGDLWAFNSDFALRYMAIGMCAYTSDSGESWVGVVSSKNRLFSQWYSRAFQASSFNIFEHMRKAMTAYCKSNNNVPPNSVIIFRRSLPAITAQETADIRAALAPSSIVNRSSTKVAFVALDETVSLAENLKEDLKKESSSGEIEAALLRFQSELIYEKSKKQSRIRAFSIENGSDSEITKADIIKLMEQLRNMYFNVPSEMNLPAPVLYAEKCAEFVAEVLNGEQSASLGDTLYYL